MSTRTHLPSSCGTLRTLLTAAFAAALLLGPGALWAQGVDTGFGVGGHVTISDYPDTWEAVHDLAVDSQGRILLAFQVDIAGEWWPALIRLLPDGSLDGSFGFGGLWLETTVSTGGLFLGTRTLVDVDSQDRPVVAWTYDSTSGAGEDLDIYGRRLTVTGASSTTFHAEYDSAPDFDTEFLTDLLVLPGDRVMLVADVAIGADDSDFGFFALAPTGADTFQPDSGWSATGWRTVFFDLEGRAPDVPLAATFDGTHVVVVGYAATAAGSRLAIAKLDAVSGAPDQSFDHDGKVDLAFSELGGSPWPRQEALAVAPRPGGGYTVAGEARDGASDHAMVMQVTDGGQVDTSFNGGLGWWISLMPYPGQFSAGEAIFQDVAMDLDGSISLVGTVFHPLGGGEHLGTVMRMNADGSGDVSFAPGGILTLGFDSAGGDGTAFNALVPLQTLGNSTELLVAGELMASTSSPPDTASDLLVTRITLGVPLFEDGFESGGTTAWSSSVP